ncbi:MAG: segregation/condensation protein A [Acidobacteria bacterium]|nr:segregation/condensation protein A [Acidobacteriota bacterium]
MDPALLSAEPRPAPSVSLPAFEGPLDLLLHLVRENKVSIWDIPIAKICLQYQATLRKMEELDLEVAGEYLVVAAWLLAIKSRMLLPRHADLEENDPRQELVERLIEYEKVKATASELAGLEEVRRGMAAVRVAADVHVPDDEIELEEVDVLALAAALRDLLERHRRDHPAALELAPMRFSVREKIVELFGLIQQARSFPLLSHLLTRPDRLESVTFLIASLELVRLGTAGVHQRRPFAEIYLTPTGLPLPEEALTDV